MKDANTIRKIDELGRIVIPKEIRKSLKIRNDDFVEIFIENDAICLKKYSKIKNLKSFAQQLTDLVYSFTNKDILITDKYNIIAYSGEDKKKYINKEISNEILESINRRESIMQNHIKDLKIIDDDLIKGSYVMDTIISSSESIGLIIMYSKDDILNQSDMNIIKIISSFLDKYLED